REKNFQPGLRDVRRVVKPIRVDLPHDLRAVTEALEVIAVTFCDRDARSFRYAAAVENPVDEVQRAPVRTYTLVEINVARLVLRNPAHNRHIRQTAVGKDAPVNCRERLRITPRRDEIECVVEIHRGDGIQSSRVRTANLALELESHIVDARRVVKIGLRQRVRIVEKKVVAVGTDERLHRVRAITLDRHRLRIGETSKARRGVRLFGNRAAAGMACAQNTKQYQSNHRANRNAADLQCVLPMLHITSNSCAATSTTEPREEIAMALAARVSIATLGVSDLARS